MISPAERAELAEIVRAALREELASLPDRAGAPEVFTREDAAKSLRICVSSLDKAIRKGLLRVARKGTRVLIHRDELERFAKRDIGSIRHAKPKLLRRAG